MMIVRLICVLIGYVCGLFQTSYILGRLSNIDIRNYGSGNAGTTNALRTMGKKAGVLTLLGDLLKPMVAYLIVWLLFHARYPDMSKLLCMYSCAGAVLGHIFPIYLGFHGGKGIATIAGLGIIFGYWPIILSGVILFVAVTAITRYVSLGSICLMLMFLIEVLIFGQMGLFTNLKPPYLYEWYGIVAVVVCISIFKHRANIQRLLNHTENKLSFSGQGSAKAQQKKEQ